MIQPQAINIMGSNQAVSAAKPGRKAANNNSAQSFSEMMRQDNGPKRAQSAKDAPKPVRRDKPSEVEDPNMAALNSPATAQPQADATLTPQEMLERVTQIVESIVAILEGNQDNAPVDTEIVPLLEELWQLSQQPVFAESLKDMPRELNDLLEEVMARMPLQENIAELPRELDWMKDFAARLREHLSPPANVNDDAGKDANIEQTRPEGQVITFKPRAESHTQAGSDNDSNSNEPKTQANAELNTSTAGSVVDIASQKATFVDALAKAGAPARPFTAQNIFDVMVERAALLPGAEPHMEIHLKPDNLGKINIDLHMGPEGLTAKIIANDENVRNLLAGHINRLSETLAEKGIRVESVEVIYTELSDQPFNRQQSGESGRESRHNRRVGGITGPEAASGNWWDTFYELPADGDDGGLGLSSVEYRA